MPALKSVPPADPPRSPPPAGSSRPRASRPGGAVYARLTCGGLIVALLIEYGLFRLIVDAVDVLIDTGRRAAKE